MPHDIRFEAEFLRGALLLNLISEADVVAWADAVITRETDVPPLVIELAMTKPELSALRSALWPLTLPAEPRAAGAALLTFLVADDALYRFAPAVVIGMLGLMRSEKMLSEEQSDAVKVFGARLMLGNANIEPEKLPTREKLLEWLELERTPGYFRVTTGDADECAALFGAISRHPGADGRAWLETDGVTLVLDERLWRLMRDAYSPIPVAARIPYSAVSADARRAEASFSLRVADQRLHTTRE